MVAESPSSIPAAARMSAPVQTETTVPLWRRTNSRICGFSLACVLAPSPPGTISRSRAGASCKMQSGTTCSPWRQRTYSGWCAITRDREIRVQRLEGGGVGDVIDGIEPDLLRQRRVQHGGVDRFIERAEARGECAHPLVAVYLQVEDLHRQCVARCGAFDVKGTGQGIIAFH